MFTAFGQEKAPISAGPQCQEQIAEEPPTVSFQRLSVVRAFRDRETGREHKWVDEDRALKGKGANIPLLHEDVSGCPGAHTVQ